MSLLGLQRLLAAGVEPGRGDEDSVRRQWWAALATLQEVLLLQDTPPQGVWLAAPLPALYEPALLSRLQGWVWAPAAVDHLLGPSSPLLPSSPASMDQTAEPLSGGCWRLPLQDCDGTDPVLVLITPALQVGMALDGPKEARRLLVRFDAAVLSDAMQLLGRRLQLDDPVAAGRLRAALHRLGPLKNDPQLGMRFWPLLAQRLSGMAASVTLQPVMQVQPHRESAADSDGELALLEALTHEVRTPLATIRTLIRSLLRRGDLPVVVRERLEQIDGECTEQIDRFGLIFLAAELQRQPGSGQPMAAGQLARTDLSQLLRRMEDLWQRQLERRDLLLDMVIDDDLPPVLSDPSRLETMLGGLMDRFSRSLPSGRQVRLSLQAAGLRLKLQLSSPGPRGKNPENSSPQFEGEGHPATALVGPVLSWNPATGSLQLSSQATRRLLHRLGGRLKERDDTSLTVFFPLAERTADGA